MSTLSPFLTVNSIFLPSSSRLNLPPAFEQEGRGGDGHQEDSVDRRRAEVLEPQAPQDLDRDRAGFIGVEDDRGHEVAQGGDEGEPRPGGVMEFTATVLLSNEIIATGMGLNKKQAEQLAAERALTALGV